MTKMGRPSSYTPEKALAICERLAQGESLRSICSETAMPDQKTIFRWLADPERDDFRQQYAGARDLQADAIFDEMLDIADDATNDWMEKRRKDGELETVPDMEHLQRSRLRIDTRKWMASKLAPKKYGEKVDIGGNIGITAAIGSESLSAALRFLAENSAGAEGGSDAATSDLGET